MTTATIVPGAERVLPNRVGLGQTLANSFSMAWRGLIRMYRLFARAPYFRESGCTGVRSSSST